MNNQPGGRGPGDQTRQNMDDRAGAGAVTSEGPKTGGLEEAVREDLKERRQPADEPTELAKTAVSNVIEDKKNLAARQLDGVVSALEKVGTELERLRERSRGFVAWTSGLWPQMRGSPPMGSREQ